MLTVIYINVLRRILYFLCVQRVFGTGHHTKCELINRSIHTLNLTFTLIQDEPNTFIVVTTMTQSLERLAQANIAVYPYSRI